MYYQLIKTLGEGQPGYRESWNKAGESGYGDNWEGTRAMGKV